MFGGDEPYGVCAYRSALTERFFFFITAKDGPVEQYELKDSGGGKVNGTPVHTLKLGSLTEDCVADDELGLLYLAEEMTGIWKFGAEPDVGVNGTLVAKETRAVEMPCHNMKAKIL